MEIGWEKYSQIFLENLHLPFPARPIDSSFEKRYRFTVLVFYFNPVDTDFVGKAFFGCDGSQHVALPHLFDMGNRSFDGYCFAAVGVGGKGQSAIGQGVSDTAVGDAEAIEHFAAHGHPEHGTSSALFYALDAEPLAEIIIFVHSVHAAGGKGFFHGWMVGWLDGWMAGWLNG